MPCLLLADAWECVEHLRDTPPPAAAVPCPIADKIPTFYLSPCGIAEVRFGAAQGQSYRVESSTDMQTWTPVEEHIIGDGGTVARLYSTHEIPKRFFRAVRE